MLIIIMDETTKECQTGDRCELLYMDDLVITAESKVELIEAFTRWQELD